MSEKPKSTPQNQNNGWLGPTLGFAAAIIAALIGLFAPVVPSGNTYITVSCWIQDSINSSCPTIVTETPIVEQGSQTTPYPIPTTCGISRETVDSIMISSTSLADLISNLDGYFNQNSEQGVFWLDDSHIVEIVGEAVFWTNMTGYTGPSYLPSEIISVRSDGGYGVFIVPQGVQFTIPTPNSGGRYLRISDTCSQVINVIASSTPIIGTPFATPTPSMVSSSSSPELLDTLVVSGNSNTSIQYSASQSGTYIFQYNSGAYCVYPEPSSAPEPSCLAAIWIFSDGANFWASDGRSLNTSTRLAFIAGFSNCNSGRSGYCNTTAEASAIASGMPAVSFDLNAGDTLHFIAVDHYEAYWDNPGEVMIDVYRS